MTHTPFQTTPPKAPSTKVNVQKTWRAHGWKPGKKAPDHGTTPTYTNTGTSK